MEIRAIARSELPQLLALYRQLHPGDAPPSDPAQVQAIWDELMASPRYRYIGVFADDRLLATCTISIIPNLTRACRPYGVIENVVTDAAHRGKGLGKAVLKEAIALAWQQQCYKVVLTTSRKDDATVKFYEAAGFDRHDKQAFVVRPD